MPPGSFLFDQPEAPAFALLLVNGCVELLGLRGTEETTIASQLGITRATFPHTLSAVVRHGFRVEGEMVNPDNTAAARKHFHLDPLIDGLGGAIPGQAKRNWQ